MKNKTLTKATITLALFIIIIMATDVHAMAPRDVDDLVGVRASSGESELEDRGYQHRKTIKVSHSTIAYWWNRHKQACIAVTTTDGRFKSIMTQPKTVCDKEATEAPSGGFGKSTPQVMEVDNGNVAVDLGGCTVLFNPHGGIVDQGESCSRGEIHKAKNAFNAHKKEQGAPAGAEAPLGGFSGQNAVTTVTCESIDKKYQFCRQPLGPNARVRLQTRLSSGTYCVKDKTWGYDADGIWVDKGCRAVFEIR